MKRIVFFIVFLFTVGNVQADCSSLGCQNVAVENLYVTATSSTLVMTSGDESQLNCSGTDGRYVTLNVNDPQHELIYSALLTAMAMQKNIQVNIVPGSVGCTIQRVELGKY